MNAATALIDFWRGPRYYERLVRKSELSIQEFEELIEARLARFGANLDHIDANLGRIEQRTDTLKTRIDREGLS